MATIKLVGKWALEVCNQEYGGKLLEFLIEVIRYEQSETALFIKR
jgi:hypothetical protein